jgi:putative heme-binding domain-containing protein
LALILVLAGTAAAQTQKNPLAGDAMAAESGRGMFRIYCSPCHGIKGEGGRGPDLTRGTYSSGDRDQDLFDVIQGGVPGTEMPGFSSRFGDDGVWRLVTYLRSAARREAEAVTGDKAAGEKLFWGKGACGGCHVVNQKGGRLGPELSRVGRLRSLAYLRASVSDPNADLTPGYNTIVAVTREGQKLVGVERNFDNFYTQFMDSSEKLHSYRKADLASVKREFRTLMPDNYNRLFNQTELNDLLAYLVSLRGEEGNK